MCDGDEGSEEGGDDEKDGRKDKGLGVGFGTEGCNVAGAQAKGLGVVVCGLSTPWCARDIDVVARDMRFGGGEPSDALLLRVTEDALLEVTDTATVGDALSAHGAAPSKGTMSNWGTGSSNEVEFADISWRGAPAATGRSSGSGASCRACWLSGLADTVKGGILASPGGASASAGATLPKAGSFEGLPFLTLPQH